MSAQSPNGWERDWPSLLALGYSTDGCNPSQRVLGPQVALETAAATNSTAFSALSTDLALSRGHSGKAALTSRVLCAKFIGYTLVDRFHAGVYGAA